VGCAALTSLDDLGGHDASSGEASGGDAVTPGNLGGPCFDNGTCNTGLVCVAKTCVVADGGADAEAEAGIPNVLCGTSTCDYTSQLCCTNGTSDFCTQQCAGPDWAFACDDTRQCVARHDSGTGWACCLQTLDSGTYVASLCGQGCARAVCNPTSPDCPAATACSAQVVVDNYTLHYCQ
jgi:hypothetical protein